jgi:hypothetical protein
MAEASKVASAAADGAVKAASAAADGAVKATGDAANKAAEAAAKMMNFFESRSVASILIQVVLGILVVIFIYWMSLIVLRSDNLSNSDALDVNKKREVAVIDGYAQSSQLAGTVYTTIQPYAHNYQPLHPSSNIKGGAQFTYSFWMKVDQPRSALNKVIFIRGDKKNTYTYKTTDRKNGNIQTVTTDYATFCPMVSFGASEGEFVVDFNTVHKIKETMHISKLKSDNNVYRKNLMSLMTSKWFLMTIVFEDNIPINDFENGLRVDMYINEILYQSGTWPTMMKQNTGDLFFFPETSVNGCAISDFRYYNYALAMPQIQSRSRQGPSSKPISSTTKSFSNPMVLSDYNKLDIYNT